MAYIPGYLATLEVNGSPINQWSSSASLARTTNAIPKNTIGRTTYSYANGKKDNVMSVTMHCDTAALVQLQAADDSTIPVDCTFHVGGGTKDAGRYDGKGIITDLTVSGGAEDNWTVDLTIQGTEAWPFTAPA